MRSPIQFYPRRQALLFLTAILVPCAVLVVLGLRTLEQERQLEAKRLADEQLRLIDQARQTLLSRLEKIKLDTVTNGRERRNTAVVFVGPVLDGHLRLPWENIPDAQGFRERLNDGVFADKVRVAETKELVAHHYEDAAGQYREAFRTADEPAERSYARLLLARTLQKSGRRQESLAEYAQVLASSPDLVDEQGVPLGLYAAPPLLQAGLKRKEITEWITLAGEADRLWPPSALHMALDLAAKLGSPNASPQLAELIRDREQAEALQRDWARVLPAQQGREPVWASYGAPVWLVSVTPPVNNFDGLVVAVRADAILKQLPPVGLIRLAGTTDTSSTLGDSFPGMRVVIPAPRQERVGVREAFLVIALLLALTFTLLAGYLVWHDVQRDLRLAEMRSQFVSSVTHELKTPLAAIRMFTETLRLDEEVDRQTRLEYLDTILHESERLSRLVDNVLDFGKIERGKKTYRFQPVRLDEVVEEAARAAQYPVEQAGFALEIVTERDLPQVGADSDALQQAILNLLTNAIKYSGGSRNITLRLDRENGDARIRVIDHGIGIAPEEQQRIFESFYRAPTVENQQIPGTGLGLTIVAHVAQAHGGRVEVESRLGSGSSFTIHLPLSRKESA